MLIFNIFVFNPPGKGGARSVPAYLVGMRTPPTLLSLMMPPMAVTRSRSRGFEVLWSCEQVARKCLGFFFNKRKIVRKFSGIFAERKLTLDECMISLTYAYSEHVFRPICMKRNDFERVTMCVVLLYC